VHQATHFDGVGSLGPVIQLKDNKVKEMTKVDDGVLCTAAGKDFFIPSTNIISLEFLKGS
jgi:hypothetical protein